MAALRLNSDGDFGVRIHGEGACQDGRAYQMQRNSGIQLKFGCRENWGHAAIGHSNNDERVHRDNIRDHKYFIEPFSIFASLKPLFQETGVHKACDSETDRDGEQHEDCEEGYPGPKRDVPRDEIGRHEKSVHCRAFARSHFAGFFDILLQALAQGHNALGSHGDLSVDNELAGFRLKGSEFYDAMSGAEGIAEDVGEFHFLSRLGDHHFKLLSLHIRRKSGVIVERLSSPVSVASFGIIGILWFLRIVGRFWHWSLRTSY